MNLTAHDCDLIVQLKEGGMSNGELAEKFEVTRDDISHILNGQGPNTGTGASHKVRESKAFHLPVAKLNLKGGL